MWPRYKAGSQQRGRCWDGGPNAASHGDRAAGNGRIYVLAEQAESIDNPMHEAAKRGNLSWLRECLDNRVGINGLDKAGNTALYWGCHGGHKDVVEVLLAQANIELNQQNKLGDTALHAASWKGYADIVELLLSKDGLKVEKDKQIVIAFTTLLHCNDDTRNCQSGMNIEGAWKRGYTGKNVVVTILDDGIERNHPDLVQNFDSQASFDVNSNDNDPMPRYDASNENKHGTRCAGEVAATANNSHCIVGIAYNARIGGVRMLDGDVTDMVEAKSLSLQQQYIDIYSASWGPDDDGKTVDGPATLARQAFETGIRAGRKGLGSVFVWASGNGGRSRDHCSCDGYTNSIYTISISSTAESGKKPWYLEECASTLTTTFSSGENYDRKIVTTDLRHRCTDSHTGTSASAPMAAAIVALALEANQFLTWRDVQHIIVKTSRPVHLIAPDWKTNAAGYKVSHLYGFGLMDAEAMVKEAERWRTVPPQHICVEPADKQIRTIRSDAVVRIVFKATGCADNSNHRVIYLEHVVVRITIHHFRRGDLSIYLTSPSGTKSQLLANRLFDHSMEGFKNWDFMTTHCWGEKAAGDWILEIYDSPSQIRNHKTPGKLKEWTLILYGTSVHPYSYQGSFDNLKQEKPRSPEEVQDDYYMDEYIGGCNQ
ncbi:PCSK5 convertase, partial [Polypterus senegalus]